MRRCTFCMRETDDDHICRYCGKDENTPANPRHLPAGTSIGENFVIGRSLEQTEEAIVYAALDLKTEERIRIYEYFPRKYARRNTRTLEVAAIPGSETPFNDGKEVMRANMGGMGCNLYEGNGTLYAAVTRQQAVMLRSGSNAAVVDFTTENNAANQQPDEIVSGEYIDYSDLNSALEEEEDYEEERLRRRNHVIMAVIGVVCVILLVLGIWMITRDSVDQRNDALPTLLPQASAIATQTAAPADPSASPIPTPDPSTGFIPIPTDNPSWVDDTNVIDNPDQYDASQRPTRRPTSVPTATPLPTTIPTQVATPAPTSPVTGEAMVWYTNGGRSYHVDEHCQGMQNATLHPISEAIMANKARCEVCNAPAYTAPTALPTVIPTELPTVAPTIIPTPVPTQVPTQIPTIIPTAIPTEIPTSVPSSSPTQPQATESSETMVWYTNGGRSYHIAEHCQGMQGASLHTLSEAITAGKQWCEVCRPPVADFVPNVTEAPTEIPTLIPQPTEIVTPQPTEIADTLVWYTSGGRSYHIEEHCQGMQNAQRHTLAEAIVDGKDWCPVCQPPQLPGYETPLPTIEPQPTEAPTLIPTEAAATDVPATEQPVTPTELPTAEPTSEPVIEPTSIPTDVPTEVPTVAPTAEPAEVPTEVPTEAPTEAPTEEPTAEPTEVPTEVPTAEPTEVPTESPTEAPERSPYTSRQYSPQANYYIPLDNGSRIMTIQHDTLTTQATTFAADGSADTWYYVWVDGDGLYRTRTYGDVVNAVRVIGDYPQVGDSALGGSAVVTEVTEEGVTLSNGDQIIYGMGIIPSGVSVSQLETPRELTDDERKSISNNINPYTGGEIIETDDEPEYGDDGYEDQDEFGDDNYEE